jgi:alginate O-acetyltransferase complex protein AlgI
VVFSSTTFLFAFLPLVLFAMLLSPRGVRNLVLLLLSLLFYAWGELQYVLLMLASIALNYLFGSCIHRARQEQLNAKAWLVTGIIANLGLLAYFKYANFLADNWNWILGQLGAPALELAPVHLPLGISFFTFQAMSYLLDVYRGDAQHDRNPINIALYIALFPQLIAGPIVRYHDIAEQIRSRVLSIDLAYSGLRRFIYGLAKKMLIANPMGEVADQVFGVGGGDLTTPVAWLGLLCYTLQIYFDFSGYSDMAIGLGRMLGFRFLENFDYPYSARSVREFWRRWHISLSSWFRDYLYIPLGGNRAGPWRTYFNLVTVFFLCGLWHGASWNFVIWGLMHGALLVIERTRFGAWLDSRPAPLAHAYTLFVVMLAWVFFRAETLPQSLAYLDALLLGGSGDPNVQYLALYLNPHVLMVLVAGVLLSIPLAPRLELRVLQPLGSAGAVFNLSLLCVLFVLCLMTLAAGAYNPFIYFRF